MHWMVFKCVLFITASVLHVRVEMMNLATLMFLLASTAVAITNGRVLQLSNSDKQLFVKEHNLLRAGVSPAAVNMKPMVTARIKIKGCVYSLVSTGVEQHVGCICRWTLVPMHLCTYQGWPLWGEPLHHNSLCC